MKAMSQLGFGAAGEGVASEEEEGYRAKIMEALRKGFRPEFLNRIDDIVIFHPLRQHDIEKIVDIQLGLIEKRLADRRITLSIDAPAKHHLAVQGFDAEFGARPLKRLMQKMILDALADRMIRGELKDGGKVKVNFKSNSLVFSV